jgi:hypothetical protein
MITNCPWQGLLLDAPHLLSESVLGLSFTKCFPGGGRMKLQEFPNCPSVDLGGRELGPSSLW